MIHHTAIIDPGAVLGNGVEIGPFTCIAGGVRIGNDCVIGGHVTIHDGVEIGDGCRIHTGGVIGDIPQDLGFKNVPSHVRIGARCVIREGVTIHRGTAEGSVTGIGEDCYLMAFSHFAHNVMIGDRVVVANGALLAGYVEVGERCFISGNCLVHQFVKIGRLVILGGGSAVSKDVPPFCMTRPVSLNTVSGLNVIGMKRGGMDAGARADAKEAFRIYYRSGNNRAQALAILDKTFHEGPAADFSRFIAQSKRGICAFGGIDNGQDL